MRSYMQTREYRDLRQTTKTGYASRLETIRTKHGHRLVAEMTRERIVKAFLDPYADRPGAALSDDQDAPHPDQARDHARLARAAIHRSASSGPSRARCDHGRTPS